MTPSSSAPRRRSSPPPPAHRADARATRRPRRRPAGARVRALPATPRRLGRARRRSPADAGGAGARACGHGDLVRRDARKVHRAMRAANAPDAALDRDRLDEAMHEARKEGQRLRYAPSWRCPPEVARPRSSRSGPRPSRRLSAGTRTASSPASTCSGWGQRRPGHGDDRLHVRAPPRAELLHANHAERDFRRAAQRPPRPTRAAAAWVSTK